MKRWLPWVGLFAACSDEAELPPIRQEVFTHDVAVGTPLSTGDFFTPSLTFGSIPVDARFKHVLTFQMSPMLPPHRGALRTSGPLVLYSDALEVIVFSPMDHFFEALIGFEDGKITYGLEGEIKTVSAPSSHRFLMVEGQGLGRTIDAWGAILQAAHGHAAVDRYADRGLSHLGYWTDNGAYYYYRTEPGQTEEQTLLGVKADADQRGIPYGYFQLDSWWYFKAPGTGFSPYGGVTDWAPQPEMFPDGLTAFSDRLGLPLLVHNRWFAVDNVYKAEFPFVADEGPQMALPEGRGLFDRLMETAKSWGVFTYEQDWLMPQFWGVPHLRNGIGHAAGWMGAIDSAAKDRGLTVQITMPGAAHLLDALDRPSVTTVRTSIDYAPEAPKTAFWPQFHTVNMLASALGVLPFKDNFHSSETWGKEEALISILSAGMVGGGDRIGLARPEILLPTCNQAGLLLKPDRPATPLDAMFLPHRRPYLTTTRSTRDVGTWHYLAAYHFERGDEARRQLDDFYAVIAYSGEPIDAMFILPEKIDAWSVDLAADLGIEGPVVRFDWETKDAAVVEETFELRPTTEAFKSRYVILAPIFDNGLALLGEPAKYVTVADRRFESIAEGDDEITVKLAGAPGETVELWAYDADDEKLLSPVQVTLDAAGAGAASLGR